MFISSVLSYHIILSFLSLSDNFRNYFLHIKKEQPQIFHHTAVLLFYLLYCQFIYSLSDIKSISLEHHADSLINQEYDQGCQSIFEYVEWEMIIAANVRRLFTELCTALPISINASTAFQKPFRMPEVTRMH